MIKNKNSTLNINRFIYLGVFILLFIDVMSNPLDSVKIEIIKGKKFIIHKVDKGQGLYAIARRYNIDVQYIIDANGEKIDKLNRGDLLRIPIISLDSVLKNEKSDNPQGKTKKIVADKIISDSSVKKTDLKIDESHANADSKEVTSTKTHIVLQGETVNKIAQKYKITPQLLIKWNGIRDNKLEVGQELIVNGTLVIKPYEKWNTPNSVAPKNNSIKNSLATNNIIEESGFAGLGTSNSILHKTLPIGTLIYITDLDTGKGCYIKVTGKLEQQYQNLILIIDEETKDKLNSSSSLIRINIKYTIP